MEGDLTNVLKEKNSFRDDSGSFSTINSENEHSHEITWKALNKRDRSSVFILGEFEKSQTCSKKPCEKLRIVGILSVKNTRARENMRNALIRLPGKEYSNRMKILYHGTCVEAIEKILRTPTQFIVDFKSKNGMLGAGIYFAPDPNKAYRYCGRSEYKHILRCIVYLGDDHKYAQPSDDRYRNTVFDEYVIRHSSHVLITHIIRCEQMKGTNKNEMGRCTGGLVASEYDQNIIWKGWKSSRNIYETCEREIFEPDESRSGIKYNGISRRVSPSSFQRNERNPNRTPRYTGIRKNYSIGKEESRKKDDEVPKYTGVVKKKIESNIRYTGVLDSRSGLYVVPEDLLGKMTYFWDQQVKEEEKEEEELDKVENEEDGNYCCIL